MIARRVLQLSSLAKFQAGKACLSVATNSFGSSLPTSLGLNKSGDEAPGNWEKAWTEKTTPWDTAVAAPPLVMALLKHPSLVSNHSRVLVPGSGSGHDAKAIAVHALAQGRHSGVEAETAGYVLGLDLAPTATSTAVSTQEGSQDGVDLMAAGRLRYQTADFFKHRDTIDRPYDMIWDYTFYCALPPSMRRDWAAAMTRLVQPGTGRLVTLLFPVGKFEGGPPFAVDVEAAREELEEAGFVCEELEAVPGEHSLKPRRGREWLGIWSLTEGHEGRAGSSSSSSSNSMP